MFFGRSAVAALDKLHRSGTVSDAGAGARVARAEMMYNNVIGFEVVAGDGRCQIGNDLSRHADSTFRGRAADAGECDYIFFKLPIFADSHKALPPQRSWR